MISAETDRILRQCCQLFEQFCVQRSCCFMPLRNTKFGATTVSKLEEILDVPSASVPRSVETKKCGEKSECASSPKSSASTEKALNEKDNTPSPASLRTLCLQVKGMDCASCTGKVNRALSMLSSVHQSNFDYFTAKVTLIYDPELIGPDAISKYIARATGFEITPSMASGDAEDGGKKVYSLPVKFGLPPDHDVLNANGISMTKNKGYYTLSFTMDPRPAMDLLKNYQPSLLPWNEAMELSDSVKQDLVRACIKSIASLICVVPILVFAWADLDYRKRNIYNGLSLGFTSIIMLISQSIFSSSVRSILYLRQVDTSLLVGVSTVIAYIYSVCAYSLQLGGIDFDEPFFETPALLLTLVLVGHAVQAFARKSSGSAIRALQNLQIDQAILVLADGTIEPIDIRLLQYGDVIRVYKDEAVATDGIVVKGETWADESSASGESVPVPKKVGNNLIAGSVIVGPELDFQVTRLVHENFLSRLQNLVSDAQQSRSSVQDLADRTAAVILPVSAVGACIAFIAWSVVSRLVRKQSPQDSAVSGLTYFIAVLVVACPCALVLVVCSCDMFPVVIVPFPLTHGCWLFVTQIPLVTAVVMRLGLRQGVVFRSNESLWTSRHVDVIAFDKTGTLTQGQLAVVDSFLLDEACDLVAALVQNQPHPVAKAVSEWLTNQESPKITPLELKVENVIGQGMKATYQGFGLRGGSKAFADENGGDLQQKQDALSRLTGYTMFYVTLSGSLIAYFALQDQPRPESFDLVRQLQNMGKEVIVLSGDLPGPVSDLASRLGIPPNKAYARLSPAQKLEAIRRLQQEGKKVCYTGDGSNDSPALAQADAAFAISGGTEAAKGAAGAVIFANDIRTGILSALRLAQLNRLHVIIGLTWSIVYNIFALLLASGAFVKVRISPAYAGLGEVVSVLPVVAIAFGVNLTWQYKSLV
jgi:P-type E1-E2 ATPase